MGHKPEYVLQAAKTPITSYSNLSSRDKGEHLPVDAELVLYAGGLKSSIYVR